MRITRLFRHLRRNHRGQALVEMAIILPVFLLMVLGMIDLARAWNIKQVITDAAREAARNGVVDSQGFVMTTAYVEGIAATALTNAGLDLGLASITSSGVNDATNTPLQIDITYPYPLQFMSIFYDVLGGGGPILLQTRIIMRNE